FIVLAQPGVKIGLQLLERAVHLLAERYSIELVERRLVEAFADSEQRSVPGDPLDVETGVFRIGQYIWDVDHSALERRSPGDTAASRRSWMLLEIFLSLGRETVPRDDSVEFAVTQEDEGIRRLAKVGCRLDQGVEHRLKLEGRVADDL